MTYRNDEVSKLAAISAAALLAGGTLFAASASAAQERLSGQLVNLTVLPGLDEEDGDASSDGFRIEGIGVSDDGEVFTRQIIGNHAEGAWARLNQADVTWSFEDGSILVLDSKGRSWLGEQNRPEVDGRKHCVAATGRFEGALCEITWSLTQQPDGSYAGQYEGLLTLPN